MKRLLASTAVLLTLNAWAAGGKEETVKGDKPPPGGSTVTSSGAAAGEGSQSVDQSAAGVKSSSGTPLVEKPWALSVGMEYHRMFIDNPNGGDKANTNLLYYYASFRWAFTKHDKVSVRFGLAEHFLADQGETGVRTDDIGIGYGHDFTLPWELNLGTSVSFNIPLSYYSQLMGLITAPGAALDLSRKFGPLSASVRAFGGVFIQRYDSMGSSSTMTYAGAGDLAGVPNPKARLGFAADISLDVPRVDGLSVGVDAYTGYAWFYAPHYNSTFFQNQMYEGDPGIAGNGTYPGSVQPATQSYGGEVYVRYNLPEVWKIKSELSAVLADGDPTLGYNSVLHDGVGYFYLYNFHTAEFYVSLSARY